MHLQKTRGIVLKLLPFNDKNKIVKVYTEHFGLRAFIVGAGSSKLNRGKLSLLQATQPIWLETAFTETGKLSRLGEVTPAASIINAMQHHTKRSMLLFIDEVLYKCLREEQADDQLFNFIFDSIVYLDKTTQNCNNFHLVFLMRLSHHLGFLPTGNYSSVNRFFHYKDGIFDCFTTEGIIMDEVHSELFSKFIELDYQNMESVQLNAQSRNKLLNNMLLYFATHMPSLSNFKSLEILTEIHAV